MPSLNGLLRDSATNRVRAGWRLLLGVSVGLPAVLVCSSLANAALPLPFSVTAANAAATVVVLALLAGLTRLDGRSLAAYRLVRDRGWRGDLLVGFAVGALVHVLALAVLLALGWGRIDGWFVPGDGSIAVGFVAFVAAFCLVGVWEEGYFRGFLLTTLTDLLPVSERAAVWAAVGASGTVFGLLHYAQAGTGLALLFWVEMGLVLGALVVLTGRLWLAIGLHAGIDVFANVGIWRYGETPLPVVVDVAVDGPTWATGVAGGVNVAVGSLCSIALLWWASTRRLAGRDDSGSVEHDGPATAD
ncbi:CPBP family intramembrane glutamic endopeptidase [Haloarchaeobius sp. DFWS5]|uniref:CPBP family intramembrane glutamic endopeptidase n=1 Tax=Haloarchaeobius sp. DFWS5 TaxID=3446114 RepID=UPI003EBCC98A